MAKEIKNRRENVLINEIPPEILTEAKLSSDGFVKNTDYATSTTAGVVKGQVPNGVVISSAGYITAAVRSLEQYTSAATSLIIGKGTLENVIQDVIERMLAAALDDSYTQAETGTTWRILLRKADGGPSIDFAVQT